MRHFKLIITSILILFSFGYTYSQSKIDSAKLNGNLTEFSAGYFRNDIDQINSFLKENNFQELREPFEFSLGKGYFVNDWYFLGNFHLLLPTHSSNSQDKIKTTFAGYGLNLSVGKLVLNKRNFLITPFVGIDYTRNTLRFKDESINSNSINIVGLNSNNAMFVYQNTFFDLGIRADKLFVINEFKQRKFLVAIKTGLLLGDSKRRARYNNDVEVSDFPHLEYNQFYLKLSLGMFQ